MDDLFPTFRRFVGFFWTSWTNAAERQALLRLIAVATEDSIPLVPLIEAWATDERGGQRERLTLLARLLEAGTALPDAVEAVPGILRDEDVLAIRFGAQSGTLASTIREVLDESQSATTQYRSRIRHALIYFCNVLLIGSCIVAFTSLKIMPMINRLYEEFDVRPPSITRWTWRLMSAIGSAWILVPIAAFIALWFVSSARPGRFLRRTVFARLFYFVRELRAADVLEKLSVASTAGRPIPGALSTLARYHFDPIVRNKLLFVRNEVEQGAEVWQSMATAGLVTPPEVRVLETAERVGNRPWALRQLALGKERRTMRRLDRLSELLLPILVVVMGAFVLVQAITVFLFLSKTLESLL
jgi:type II secretory pathway component PulF